MPAQGRVGISGSPSGITVTADGDKDNNTPVTSDGTGWAVVSVGTGGAGVSCGKSYDKGGHGDTDVPDDGAQANCG